MSKGARKFVKALRSTPDGSVLSSAHKLLLRELAFAYDDARGCAIYRVKKLAEGVGWSEGHTRRVVAWLEKHGMVRRYAALRANDKSQTSNDYEIVGYVCVVDAAARLGKGLPAAKPLRVPRQRDGERGMVRRGGRLSKQLSLELGNGVVHGTAIEDSLAAGVVAFADVRGVEEMVVESLFEDSLGEHAGTAVADVRGAVEMPVEPGRKCLSPANDRCLSPTNNSGLPIDTVFDSFPDTCIPPSPLGADENRVLPAMGKARATASTTAKATTSAHGAEWVSTESAGRMGTRFRARDFDRDRNRLSELDGEAAALELEAERVMQVCGFTPGPLTRVVREAIRLCVQSRRISIAAAGDLAIERRAAYVDDGHLLRYQVQPAKFFREGVWLTPNAWPYDSRKLEEMRMRRSATTGQMRGSAEAALQKLAADKAVWERERQGNREITAR